MPKPLQERKRGHADFVAQGGSAGMFRGAEKTDFLQKKKKKHVQRQRRHAEGHFLVFFRFLVILGAFWGAIWEDLGDIFGRKIWMEF